MRASHKSHTSVAGFTTPSPHLPTGSNVQAAESLKLFVLVGTLHNHRFPLKFSLTKHVGVASSAHEKLAELRPFVHNIHSWIGRNTVLPSISVPHLSVKKFASSFHIHSNWLEFV